MREILFRGKNSNGNWIYGNLNFYPDINRTFIRKNAKEILPSFQSSLEEEVNKNTIGQFTGLTDKNGKKIFEGDILESPIGRKAVVSFGTYKPWSTKDSDDFECWKLTLLAKNEGETKLECGLGKHCMEYMRLIGNIHDNPELLKGGAD